jgi:hypothetical protein
MIVVMGMTIIVVMVMTVIMVLMIVVPMMVVPMIMVRVAVMMLMAMLRMIVMMIRLVILRLERGREFHAREAPIREQFFDLGRCQQTNAVGQHLYWDVSIAKQPDEPRRFGEILFTDLNERLAVRNDFGNAAVVKEQKVVRAQMRSARKIKLDARPLAPEHETLLTAPVSKFQQQRVGDLAVRLAFGEDFLNARHWRPGSVTRRALVAIERKNRLIRRGRRRFRLFVRSLDNCPISRLGKLARRLGVATLVLPVGQ